MWARATAMASVASFVATWSHVTPTPHLPLRWKCGTPTQHHYPAGSYRFVWPMRRVPTLAADAKAPMVDCSQIAALSLQGDGVARAYRRDAPYT